MIPGTLKRFAAKIDEVLDERGIENGWWVYLKPGWINTASETHCIHEDTLAQCAREFESVESCYCTDGCHLINRAAEAVQENEVTETTTVTETSKTAKTTKPKTAKTAKPKTNAKPKTAKTAKTAKPKTNGTAHAFLATKDEPAKCSVCSGAPSDKRHRKALDAMRKLWWNGTAAEKAAHLTGIGFEASDAKATWTALTVEVKHLLAAALAKAEAK